MKRPDTQAWMDAHVEAYLDGVLSAQEEQHFERHLKADPSWQEAVRLAERVRDGLRALPRPVCPPHVTQTVLAAARRREQTARRVRRWTHLRQRAAQWLTDLWQPALSMAVLVLLVVAAALVGPLPAPQADLEPPYTATDVQRATTEVEWTLAYLARIGQRTGETIEHEVLSEHVAEPMRRAFGTTLDPAPAPDHPQ